MHCLHKPREWIKVAWWKREWMQNGLRRINVGVNANCRSPITFYTDSWEMLREPAWLSVANDNQSKAAGTAIWSLVLCAARNWHCLNHEAVLRKHFMLKDIDWWICPAGHRRAWGDGAWSGWRSAGGCSSSHDHLCLKEEEMCQQLC